MTLKTFMNSMTSTNLMTTMTQMTLTTPTILMTPTTLTTLMNFYLGLENPKALLDPADHAYLGL